MKKKIKKESGPSRIQKVEGNIGKMKAIREVCKEILWAFDMPSNQGEIEGPEISTLIEQISPWQELPHNEGEFEVYWEAFKVSFGLGYALGQMLDLPEIDITTIKELLREKKALLYMPHEKAA